MWLISFYKYGGSGWPILDDEYGKCGESKNKSFLNMNDEWEYFFFPGWIK